jgi:DNA (cytosine-5)-methyltransferase 1
MREGKEGGGKGPLVSSDQSLTLATSNDQVLAVPFRETADALTAAYGTKWNGNASADNGSLFVQTYPINTQLGLRGADTSNSSREGVGIGNEGDPSFTLQAAHSHAVAVVPDDQVLAVALRGRDGGATAELSELPSALRASQGGGDKAHAIQGMQVRRLTPRECERLQGFPDDYTLIPVKKVNRKRLLSPKTNKDGEYRNQEINGEAWLMSADGPRYKSLGNSWAVPVVRYIGEQIKRVLSHA